MKDSPLPLAAFVSVIPEEPSAQRDFAVLYRATIGPLRRYLTRLLGSPSEAQDVAHDAFLRVYPSMIEQPARSPAGLVYTAARRLAINRLKRRSISPVAREAFSPDTAASGAPGVAQQVIARQDLAFLEQALAALPQGCRAVLLLRKIEMLSHREISDRLGIAVSTVEKQHARALRLLREALEGRLDS